MVRVVDAMGGVDIDVPYPVYDESYPDPIYGSTVLSIKAGRQHMDGRIALAYARSRHQDSDYGRMERQQTLLLAIRSQLGPATILAAPDLVAVGDLLAVGQGHLPFQGGLPRDFQGALRTGTA